MAYGDQPVQQTTPPGLDPSQISPQALATLFPGSQAPAAPPPPAAPGAGGMEDYARLAAEQQRQLLSSGPAQEAAKARGESQQYAGEMASTPLPQMGPHVEKGGGFLHNLGQALQMISMVTPTGRQMFGPEGPVYGPKIAAYKAHQAGLMGQKEAAESRATEAGKEVGSLAGVAGRTIYGGSRVEAEQIGAAQRAQAVITQHQSALDRIAGMKDVAKMRTTAQEEIATAHNEVMQEIARQGNLTKEEVARIMASSAQSLLNTKIAEDPSIAGAIKRWFGVGGAEAPGGAQPVAGQTPLPSRTPAAKTPPAKAGSAVPKGTTVYDPQGKPHSSDGTHPLPKGWSLQKPGA